MQPELTAPDPAIVAGLAKAAGRETKTITLRTDDGEADAYEVTIKKLRTRQFVEVFKKIDELAAAGVVKLTDDNGAFIFSAKGIFTQFSEAKLILRGGDPALDIVSIVSGLPRDEVDTLDLLDLAKLVGAAWEVNKAFFGRNQTELKEALGEIWTTIETIVERLKPSTPAASTPPSSTDLLPAATEPSSKS